jgi:hypothetical protein
LFVRKGGQSGVSAPWFGGNEGLNGTEELLHVWGKVMTQA